MSGWPKSHASGALLIQALVLGCAHFFTGAAGCTSSAAVTGQKADDAGNPSPPKEAGRTGGGAGEAGQPSAAVRDAGPAQRAPDGPVRADGAVTSDADGGTEAPRTDDPFDHVEVPTLSAPEQLGVLAGPGATYQNGAELYGTDLGWTFEHGGALTVLFGDSMPSARFYCDTPEPIEDDTLARLPLRPDVDLPQLDFVTQHDSKPAMIRVLRDGEALKMGLGKTPLTGWSDGQRVFAVMGRVEYTPCPAGATDVCDADAGLTCVHDLGLCQPAVGDAVIACDPAAPVANGCGLGQQCVKPPTGFCVDLHTRMYDGTRQGLPFAIARSSEISVQRADEPAVFDSVYTFISKKFHNPVARGVKRLGQRRADYDYAPGNGGLLMWGRPGFFAEHGRQGQLYLLRHTLPMPVRDGRIAFEPEFFTGVDAQSGEPRWSPLQKEAVALAMDGTRNGDPSEPLPVLNQMAISWLGAPIHKWIMVYAGDVPDAMLLDAESVRDTRGPLRVRFADYPWGPFSPARTFLEPGSSAQVGAPYGPGGFLFHYACRDQPDKPCARTDPARPIDALISGCSTPAVQLDVGRMYGVNIIDAYTRPRGTGLDITWNLSTWNPYAVLLMRSHLEP